MDWHGFYTSSLQGVWLLLVAPVAFLAWAAGPGRVRARAAQEAGVPGAAFVWAWCLVFAVQTCIDPLSTGLLAPGNTAVMFLFVWLGDFRVFQLVFGLSSGTGWQAWPRAAAFTCIVPIAAGIAYFGIGQRIWPELPGHVLWLVYELFFLALALGLRARLALPQREFLRSVLAYVAAYYALWATSDVIILAGLDVGWGLRVVPNQLYYSWFVPFVCFGFFRSFIARK